MVLKDSDMESENLSLLIGLSVSDDQKTDSSKVVSFIGTVYDTGLYHVYFRKPTVYYSRN